MPYDADMEPTARLVPAADGLKLELVEWSQEGVPLLLIHGFSNSARIWDDFAPRVAPYYRTLALTLRGHGNSDHDPEGRYDWEDHVRDVEAVIDGLGVERLVLVGHSLGGRTSMLYAGRHPEKIAGLVIVDTGPEMDPRGTSRIRMEAEQRGDGTLASVEEYERVLAHNYPAATPEMIRSMAQHEIRQRDDGRWERKIDPAFMSSRAKLSQAEMDAFEVETAKKLWAALDVVQAPTLVVRGAASDVLSADVADRMADEALANGKLAVIPASAHSVMTDNPEGFAEAVSGFVLGE